MRRECKTPFEPYDDSNHFLSQKKSHTHITEVIWNQSKVRIDYVAIFVNACPVILSRPRGSYGYKIPN